MAGFTPLPPSLTHTTTRLTHLQTHTFLSSFLATAENEAAYRPDSTLSERGPVATSTGGSAALTLGNLKRILKGLEGKRVGGAHLKVDLDEGAGGKGKKRRRDDMNDGEGVEKRRRQEERGFEVEVEDGEAVIRAEENASEGSGWQDQAAFELEQDDENVDALNEERDTGANLEQPGNEQEEQEMMEVGVEGTGKKVDARRKEASSVVKEKSIIDKNKRKEDKKARRKEEKRTKQKTDKNDG